MGNQGCCPSRRASALEPAGCITTSGFITLGYAVVADFRHRAQAIHQSYCGEQTSGPDMGFAWQLADKNASAPTIIWKDGEVSAGGCSCWLGMIPATDKAGPMGVAVLANGWVNDLGGVSVEADPYGHAILTQIAANA